MSASNSGWSRRVAVTGMGCVSPLGMNCAENTLSLQTSFDAIGPVTLFDTAGCQCHTAGEIADAKLAAAQQIHKRASTWHRASQMTLLAMAEALNGLTKIQPEAAIFATTSGGMSCGEAFYSRLKEGHSARSLRWELSQYPMPQAARDALDAFQHPITPWIISNACASGSNAIGHAALLVGTGQARQVICGGYDTISQLVFAGFDCLRAATPEKCRPFDKNRTGLVLGEGAAVFVLEDFETAEKNGRTILAEIAGYGAANDNHHLTQPDPSGAGPLHSMRQALAIAGIDTVDYINAHGTGTAFNDASEAAAIRQLLPDVPVSSTKGAMGHSLGAAGAIEAAFSILALREQFLPPNLNFLTPDESAPVNVVANVSRPAALTNVISNSFGFGGSNASLVFRAAS